MTVFENLQMGASIDNFAHFDEDLERIFAMFPRLKERAPQRGGTLSGGEQQMLAIARALMSRPRLLLLDEPSLGLAPLIVKQIFNVIADLNKTAGLTVFLVEQNAFHALKLAHRGYVMVNGLDHDAGHRRGIAGAAGSARRLSRGGTLMGGLIWTDTDNGLFVFILLTVLGGAAAMASGRALAKTWSPVAHARPLYGRAGGGGALPSFLAVPGGALTSIHYYLVTLDHPDRRRLAELQIDARDADGDAIFLVLRKERDSTGAPS